VAASDCAMAAIEIVDGRVAHWKISFADTLADNGSAAFSCASETRRPGRGQGRRSRQRQLQLSVTRAMTNKKVAIIGSGNIGTDLKIKNTAPFAHSRSAAFVGIDPESDGLKRAARLVSRPLPPATQ
jgi:hypothetical protein